MEGKTDTDVKADRSVFSDAVALLSLTAAIYSCYLGYGIVQEHIYKEEFPGGEKFRFSLFLVFCQCIVNGLMAAGMCVVTSPPKDETPHVQYMKIATSYMGAMFASNYALNFISYPTQALGKSCKMIPVMLSRIVINGKSYKFREYVAVGALTAGICIFMLAKDQKSGGQENSLFGICLLFMSLALDAYTGPSQERVVATFRPTTDQLMLWINAYACAIALVVMGCTGELFEAVGFVLRHPSLITSILLFSSTSAVGQKMVLLTVFRFDSLVLTMITTTRKFFTILCSVLVHGSVLNGTQWSGVALVFAAICADIYFKASGGGAEKAKPNKKKD